MKCAVCEQKIDACDNCELEFLKGTFITCMDYGGDTFHFCDDDCMWAWLEKNVASEEAEVL